MEVFVGLSIGIQEIPKPVFGRRGDPSPSQAVDRFLKESGEPFPRVLKDLSRV